MYTISPFPLNNNYQSINVKGPPSRRTGTSPPSHWYRVHPLPLLNSTMYQSTAYALPLTGDHVSSTVNGVMALTTGAAGALGASITGNMRIGNFSRLVHNNNNNIIDYLLHTTAERTTVFELLYHSLKSLIIPVLHTVTAPLMDESTNPLANSGRAHTTDT